MKKNNLLLRSIALGALLLLAALRAGPACRPERLEQVLSRLTASLLTAIDQDDYDGVPARLQPGDGDSLSMRSSSAN